LATIHPTAVVSKDAIIGEGVSIGAFVVIEGRVVIGDGCDIQAGARLMGPLTLGKRNVVYGGATLGGWPQDRKYTGEPSETIIGDDNMFREAVTIHRGTGMNTRTIIGNRNYFMVGAHVGHNCVVHNDITMVNYSSLGGHVTVFDKAIIGASSAVHQFARVGRLAMTSAGAGVGQDLPPFALTMVTNRFNQLNVIGLRRSGAARENINAVRKTFQFLFRTNRGRPLKNAIAELPEALLAHDLAREFVDFCKGPTKRGIARFEPWSSSRTSAAGD